MILDADLGGREAAIRKMTVSRWAGRRRGSEVGGQLETVEVVRAGGHEYSSPSLSKGRQ